MISKRISDLRHRVSIISAPLTTLSGNQKKRDWDNATTLATVWASIEQKTGQEKEVGRSLQIEVKTEIVCRWVAGLTHHDRITFGNRTFRIVVSINTEEKDVEWVLDCIEILK